MRWQRLLLVLVLVAVAAAVWSRLRPSESRRILRQLDRLAERISKTESESTAIMALKLNGLGDLFAAEVEVDLADFPGNGTYASSEVASHVARFRPACRSLALSFHDTRITIGPPAQAEATFTARLHVTATNGDPQTDTRALRVRLQRDADKSWRFTRFEEIRVLQR